MKFSHIISILIFGIVQFAGGWVSAGTTTQPSLPEMIDFARQHADDQFAQFKEEGMASGLSDTDQKWLDSNVDDTQKKLDDFYDKLKSTGQPAERNNLMDISDTSDGVPYNLIARLAQDRKDLADALGPKVFFKTGAMLSVAVMSPDVFPDWFETIKVPKADIAKIQATVDRESKKIVAAGELWAKQPNAMESVLVYLRQKTNSRHAIWSTITAELNADERKALLAAMEKQDTNFECFRAKRRLEYREARSWVTPVIPTDSLADSDQMNVFTADKLERVSLVQAGDKHVVFTGEIKKGEACGFSFNAGMLGTFDAFANERSVPIEPEKKVYYWVRAAADIPLTP